LTATVLDDAQGTFSVGLAPETLDKTYFRALRPGQAVNLERASEIGGRNSGHFVQGHVDGTGTIVDKRIDGDSLRITIRVDDQFLDNIVRYVVPKGFIAIDGTSLTVVDVDIERGEFSFMLVEYTQKKIIIPQKGIGEKVNLEVDVLGKYSETAMASLLPRLEDLEAKVESLTRALDAVTGGGRAPPPPPARTDRYQAPPPPRSERYQAPPPPQQQQTNPSPQAYQGYASNQKRMISGGTPMFQKNIGGQGLLGGDPNSQMMRPEGEIDGEGDEAEPKVRTIRPDPDPKMDDIGGISGNKNVRIG
jgi:riboflavin synthase